jgi:hypothetical protein
MWKNNIMRWNQDGRVVEVRERESSGCEKRRRRICVTREEAENGLQRIVRQSMQIRNNEECRVDQQKG